MTLFLLFAFTNASAVGELLPPQRGKDHHHGRGLLPGEREYLRSLAVRPEYEAELAFRRLADRFGENEARRRVEHSKGLAGDEMDHLLNVHNRISLGVGLDGEKEKLPTNFDAREQWPNCENKIEQQGQCASCWAFATTETLEFRICMETGAKIELSVQELLSCVGHDNDCGGGHPSDAFEFAKKHGIVSKSCMPYKDGLSHGTNVKTCPSDLKCTNSTETDATVYTVSDYYNLIHPKATYEETVDRMMREVYKNGPFVVGMDASAKFENSYTDDFRKGKDVWAKCPAKATPNHAVTVFGWGEDAKQGPYWLLGNSWGSDWGNDGYFKLARGKGKDCQISTLAVAADPDTANFQTTRPKNLVVDRPVSRPDKAMIVRPNWAPPPSSQKRLPTGPQNRLPTGPKSLPTGPKPLPKAGEVCLNDDGFQGCARGLACVLLRKDEPPRCINLRSRNPHDVFARTRPPREMTLFDYIKSIRKQRQF